MGGPPHSLFAGQGHHSLPAVLDLGRRKSPSPQGMLDRDLRVSFRNEAVPQDSRRRSGGCAEQYAC